jgi:hypothetical protein
MKIERILLLLTLLGIILLFILTNFQKPTAEGTIFKITSTDSSTTINLKDNTIKFIVLNKTQIQISKNDFVKIYGTKQVGINEAIVFVNVIRK